ncbi:MAG: hypothetical protein JWP74_3813 [Marmoricola sp.]|nr:hypothetical protein [Marmoricola sp.]
MSRRTRVPGLVTALLLALSALPFSGSVASAAPAPRTSVGTDHARSARSATLSTAQFEKKLLARMNTRRKKVGCGQLKANTALTKASRKHTAQMASAGELSHQLPGEPNLQTRVVNAGYKHWRALEENVAWSSGPTDPLGVFHQWLSDSPHRKNIDNCAVHDAGLGVAYAQNGTWVTADFGRH